MWCGNDESIDTYNNEPRCGTCRERESVIAEARDFLGMYGLRPLGGSLDSEDEEERDFRASARDARAELNASRLAEPPSREQIRKALAGPQPSAVERVEGAAEPASGSAGRGSASGTARTASTSRTSPSAGKSTSRTRQAGTSRTASSPATDVDLETLESRVTTLLDKLSAIDAQITDSANARGLAAQARTKDLERQRTSVLHTLAALEKARRLQSR
ncbi:MAG: hypothetical protein L0H59_03365 [Tomitella sp.]|nr:hypothetical protein [Tomitella sp.]